MLVNFSDKCLRTDVTCSTVSTEGYEVVNLVNNSEKGFLAYSCIRPPVTIDFNFICNIKLSHVLVWPQVGAQRSSGFKLSVKSADASNQPFTDVSTGFLQSHETGIFFFRRDVAHHTDVRKSSNFAERYIKSLAITNYVSTLRLSIVKTDNSVPALSKVEIWGSVSPKCAKDVAMNVSALWMNRLSSGQSIGESSNPAKSVESKQEKECVKADVNSLQVPEDFLDPITLEIMTQPIILPSGKVIDQKTLEKHGQNEAVWGRPVTDPFTGIAFSDTRRPIAALPLKDRIDKFLLENCDKDEVKRLPRVLGSKMTQQSRTMNVISCENKRPVNNLNATRSDSALKRTLTRQEGTSNVKRSFHGHSLPVMSLRKPNSSNASSLVKSSKPVSEMKTSTSKEEVEKRNAAVEEKLNSKIQVSNVLNCTCCTNSILYKLPCEHVICRKSLLLLDRNECPECKLEFKTNEPERFHT